MFCKLSNLKPAHLEEVQLIERFANHRTSIQRLNHLLKLRHNSIKLLLSQKCSTSFNWIKPVWRSIGSNNLNTQYCKCFVSSTSFSIYTYLVHPRKPVENYETLHGLVSLEKLSRRGTRKPAEGMISQLLLREVTYRMLLLLLIMQKLFRYCRRHWVKSDLICYLFFL